VTDFITVTFTVATFASGVRLATPYLLAALGETLGQRSGVLNLGDPGVETAETVAGRIRRALEVLPPERIVVAPDCGMKYLDRDTALGKLRAMVAGADIVRREIAGR